MRQSERLFSTVLLIAAVGCEREFSTATPDVELPALAKASAPALVTETTWGGAATDATDAVAVASDGSSYLVGFTESFDFEPKLFTVKFNPDGSLAWQRTWNAPQQFVRDEGRDVAVAPDGSVYVTGLTFVDGNRALVLKYSPDGTLIWQRVFGGNAHGDAVTVGADGSVYVTGALRDPSDSEDLFVIKLSPDGTQQWFKRWGADGVFEAGQGIAVGPDGNLYVAGVAPRAGADPFLGQFDAMVLKLDPSGNVLWQRAFAGGDVADARGGIDVGADGAVYVGGGFQGPSGSGFTNEALLMRLTSDGDLVWARQWENGFAEAVAVAPDGQVVFAGTVSDADGDDAFVLRLAPGGKTTSANRWGGSSFDAGQGIAVAPDGTISLGASASAPPYALGDARGRTSRARLTVSTPATPLVDAAGIVVDPAGVAETPNGTTTYAGGFDAALVRIRP